MNSRMRRKNEARAYNAFRIEELRMVNAMRDAQQSGDKPKARVWWNRLLKLRQENPYHSTYNSNKWLERLDSPPEQEAVEEDTVSLPVGKANVVNANNRLYTKTALTAMAVMAAQAIADPIHSKGR